MGGTSTARGRYGELHAHSCFSLLDGVPFPEELAEAAARLELPALALTDHDAIYGAVPFFAKAQAVGVKPILGAEVTVVGGGETPQGQGAAEGETPHRGVSTGGQGRDAPVGRLSGHLTLLAEDQTGYRSLCRLITQGRAGRPKGEAGLDEAALRGQAAGLICLTGCRHGPVARHLLAGAPDHARQALGQLLDIFGRGQVYVELQRNHCREDRRLTLGLARLAQAYGLKCVATGNVHYLTPDDADLQDVLVSIRERLPLPRAGAVLRPNHEFYLRDAAAMEALYPDLPEAVANTWEVAERCSVALPAGLQRLPAFPTPAGQTAQAHLRQVCQAALPRYYPAERGPAQALLEKELGLIEQLGLANYFLVVADIVNFCRERGILCHGRGSAANSLVAHLLGISMVDPIAQALVVERFLSVEHGGTPDIDLDIDAARRETVIQYVYERWGRDHAAMACTYVTFRTASALRDAGFALGFKAETVEEVVEKMESSVLRPSSIVATDWHRLTSLAERLKRRPRHLGLHNGGMVVTGEPIAALVPVEPASMADRTVVQFDKDCLEQLGLVKIDLLGLRMLSAVADAVAFIQQMRGRAVALERLDLRDQAVYDQICSAKTIGIFQVESGAQVSLIPHLQPRCFQDLVIEISLIRPGPLQGNMVRPYLRRRQGQEPVTYLHPSLEPALQETLGVIVFQEQVIKVAHDFAGFTPGRGEVLRRALGHKHAQEELQKFRADFILGGVARGATPETAQHVWQMIENFAGYSFSKAHAAAFAVIVYWSAWLRVHYPVEYFCGLLRNAPLGTYPANVIESEARRVGVKFLSFDINRSQAKATVEAVAGSQRSGGKGRSLAIRFGLDYVRGIGEARAEAIVAARGMQPFEAVADCIRRTGLDRRALEALVLAGAFDGFGERRQLLWDLAEALAIAQRPAEPLPLDLPDERASLAPMPAEQKLQRTFAVTGVTAGPHLVETRRSALARAKCLSYRELQKQPNGARVRAGGLVADGLRRPPTAKGTSFIRLEDSAGLVDVIIPAPLYAACRRAMRQSVFLVVDGTLHKQGAVLSITAQSVAPLG